MCRQTCGYIPYALMHDEKFTLLLVKHHRVNSTKHTLHTYHAIIVESFVFLHLL